MNEIEGLIRQVLAIEMLEYEDKNHLSGNDKSRSKIKIELLNETMQKIKKIKQFRIPRITHTKDYKVQGHVAQPVK